MPPEQSNKQSSIQTHSADAFEHAPFDRKEHLKRAMQKKQEKAGKKRGAVAYAIQLKQKDVQLHGPRHLKAAMEQHAGTLSSAVTNAPDADTWEADPRFMPKALAKVRTQVQRRPMGQAQWTLENVTCVQPVPLSQMADQTSSNMLQLHMDATEHVSNFEDETMDLVLNAETVHLIAPPKEAVPCERTGACAAAGRVARTWGVDDPKM